MNAVAVELAPASGGPWSQALRSLTRNRAALVGLAFIILVSLLALLAPWVDRYPPNIQDDNTRSGPSWQHWLGSDQLGRDLYSELIHGARVSLAVGVFSQAMAVVVGVSVGLAAVLGGRRADSLLMRLTDISYSFPDLLLLILLASLFQGDTALIVLAIGFVSWPTIARIVRGQALSLQHDEFVLAARASGAGHWRIARYHLLPNLLGPVIATATFGVPMAIFAEATLSFIGLGPLTPSWGKLVLETFALQSNAPHLFVFACLAIALTSMSFMLVGDALRDALDPRSAPRQRSLPDQASARPPEPRPLPKAA